MSINSIGTYDSLFDLDDEGTIDGICFDLDAQQVVPNDQLCNVDTFCKAGSSSCCSLCRPPAVSDADGDSNIGLASDASFLSSRRPSLPCTCNPKKAMASSFCGECGGGGQQPHLPIKDIYIPRRCIDPRAAITGDTKVASIKAPGHDYLTGSFLPDDALCHIVKFMNVSSLLKLRECNKKLYEAASNNSAGWTDHCARLWSRKANVCSLARSMLSAESTSKVSSDEAIIPKPKFAAMEAYKIAFTDAAKRKEISYEEICFDSSADEAGAIFSFRFKESAGQDWTSWDPWWKSEDVRKLVFLKDGSIMQAYPQGLESSAKDVNGTRLYDVFSERTIRRDGMDVPAPRIEMKWRFVNRPLDLPARPLGAYVRITVGGRDVPTCVVRRSPNGNWGFVLESCWGVYASFELAPRVIPRAVPSLIPRQSRRRAIRRTRNGSRCVVVDDDSETEEDAELERAVRNVRRRIDLFLEESAMTQDGYSQWREALLYNIGAVTLPEGNHVHSGEEFDNAVRNATQLPP